MFVIFAVCLFAGRYFLSPFHQFVHVLGNLVIGDFGIDLGTGDNTFAGTTIIAIFAPT